MKRIVLTASALLAASLLGVGSANAYGLAGDQIYAAYVYTSGGTTYSDGGSTTVDPGNGSLEGGLIQYSIRGSSLSVVLPAGGIGFGTSEFNGIDFTDQTNNPEITNFSLITNTGGSTPVASFTSDSLSLNFSGVVTPYSGQTLTYQVTFAAVPEPATWAMMFAGVGAIGGALRASRSRRRQGVALAA